MKYVQIILLSLCTFSISLSVTAQVVKPLAIEKNISTMIDQWHEAAANADYKGYFNLMTDDAVFIGTDPSENWQLEAFKTFAKPYFDKGKAWSFTNLKRAVYVSENKQYGWFDELLSTQMGICRGSGIVIATQTGWKIKHYVLSITIPNENVSEVTALKQKFETNFILKLN
ncbi:nuclear transport factor 2 family protein [Aquimarina sp. W85]|uniref:nuclear transport factor 2 family protein n=1 Tax=Aquimarina rhodophyticola TaxID=3342246 RepID=UPI00367191E8